MKYLHTVAFILLVVGGLEWGLHAFGYDPVDALGPTVSMLVYILVGVSAVYEAVTHKSYCKNCNAAGGQQM